LLIVAETLLLYPLTRVASAGVLGCRLLARCPDSRDWVGVLVGRSDVAVVSWKQCGDRINPQQGGPREIYRYGVTNARGDTAYPILSPRHCGVTQAQFLLLTPSTSHRHEE